MRCCLRLAAITCVVLGLWQSSQSVCAQGLGIALPPEFEMREKAARAALFDGRWMESLRQTCESLDLLEEPKNRRGKNWSFTKARFLMWKAQILSELGVKDRALANYETAARVLVNQGNVGANDPLWKAQLEFVAGDIHRPEFIGDEEGDPQRWRQALDRCGLELERAPNVAPVWHGRQRIELARVCMFLARQAFLDRGNAAERDALLRDATNYLATASDSFANHPDWQLVCDPKDPIKFKDVDVALQAGAINQQQAIAAKEQIRGALAEWTNWRMAQAELQAHKEEEDPVLGWGFDKASVEFDKLLNFLAVQFGGDDHPVIYKTRLTRAKWYLGMAKRDIRVGRLLDPPPNGLGPKEQAIRDSFYRRALTYLHDALTEVYELQNLEMATQLMKKGCVALEKDVLEELLNLEKNAKGIVDVLADERRGEADRERDLDRIQEIKRMFANKQFTADANEKVGSTGCPLKLPGAIADLVAVAAAGPGGPGAINVSWKPPKSSSGGPARAYDVEISDDGGNIWRKVGDVKLAQCVVPGLDPGKYLLRVAARNGAGRGAWATAEAAFGK